MIQRLEAQGKKPIRGDLWDDGSVYDDVTKIFVRGDSHGIQYIWFDYVKSGKWLEGSLHSYNKPGFTQTFEIDHLNNEQLLSVEGYYDDFNIKGIQFTTNFRISELIGWNVNFTKFSLSVDGKKIIGFHGSTSIIDRSLSPHLNSLGAYFTWASPTRLEAEGCKGGKEWDDGSNHQGVTNIYVGSGREGIQYIKFKYIKDGEHVYGSDHGVKGRGFIFPFKINHLNQEYLVSVEGYYEFGVIQGLEFKTNFKTSGQIGYDDGKKFILTGNGKKIIGFYGYAGKNLNSLGAYLTASTLVTKVECRGKVKADFWDDGSFDGVRKVYITYNSDYVLGLTIFYEYGGKIIMGEHDSSLSGQGRKFEVDYPNEFITSVEGTMHTSGYCALESLTFKTSKGKTSSTFGSVSKEKFVLESKGCGVVGFHGSSSKTTLFSLGAYFRPLPPPHGTLGSDGKFVWDDGYFDGVRHIYIGHNDVGVAFLKFIYDKNNQVVVGDDHGSKTLLGVSELELDYMNEHLISVEAGYDVIDGSESKVIRMLRFKTNRRTSKDFGPKTSESFILQREDHKIVGFKGKVSSVLHEIGIHVHPISEG